MAPAPPPEKTGTYAELHYYAPAYARMMMLLYDSYAREEAARGPRLEEFTPRRPGETYGRALIRIETAAATARHRSAAKGVWASQMRLLLREEVPATWAPLMVETLRDLSRSWAIPGDPNAWRQPDRLDELVDWQDWATRSRWMMAGMSSQQQWTPAAALLTKYLTALQGTRPSSASLVLQHAAADEPIPAIHVTAATTTWIWRHLAPDPSAIEHDIVGFVHKTMTPTS